MSKDEYMLDPNEAAKQQSEGRIASEGIICPKRNASIGRKCHVCDALSKVFQQSERGSPMWDMASSKAAKATYFLNVVFPENPNKVVLMQIGKEVGNTILSRNTQGKWLDIAHPKADKGREMEITKSVGDGNYPKYSVSPSLDKASWDVPDEAIQNLYNLDQGNLIQMVQEGKVEIFKVSSMKTDETLTFRICQPWRHGEHGADNTRVMQALFRHWGGVTQDEVDGSTPVDLRLASEISGGTAGVEMGANTMEAPAPQLELDDQGASDVVVVQRKSCFGKEDFYEKDDVVCIKCPDHDECWGIVKSKVKGA